jgi:ABC-type cobalt transport system substrate-binding protein
MFCRSCGKENADEAQFCTGCGVQLRVPDVTTPDMFPERGFAQVDVLDSATTQVMETVTAPMPYALPLQVAAASPQKRSMTGLIVALVIVGVLVVGGGIAAGLYFMGAIGDARDAVSAIEDGYSADITPELEEYEAPAASVETYPSQEPALSDDESYDAIAEYYVALGNMSDSVGVAYTDKYGGTGFAYEVFNPSIGAKSLSEREKLVSQCQEMLDTVSGQKQTLDEVQVSVLYESQKTTLLSLYGLLERRAQVMLGAAQAAVDDPSETKWRPILSPASTQTREQFEAEYPLAEPVRQ